MMRSLFLILLLTLSACSQAPQQLALQSYGEDGFGGTGYQPYGDESGFGGTGVIGTIDAFGSIWVNNLHIQISDKERIPANLSGNYRLELGQQVLLTTAADESQIISEQIRIHFPIAGKVSDIRRQHLKINDQWVRWTSQTELDRQWSSPHNIQLGDWVIVSGWQLESGTWVATRFSANPKQLIHLETEITWPFGESYRQFVIEETLQISLNEQLKRLSPTKLLLRSSRFSRTQGHGMSMQGAKGIHSPSHQSHSHNSGASPIHSHGR